MISPSISVRSTSSFWISTWSSLMRSLAAAKLRLKLFVEIGVGDGAAVHRRGDVGRRAPIARAETQDDKNGGKRSRHGKGSFIVQYHSHTDRSGNHGSQVNALEP